MSLINTPKHLEGKIIVGLDEVGRGSFAGPVVTGAVIFPSDFKSDLIMDSKKLTDKQRRTAYDLIVKNAIAYSVQISSAKYINEHGINPATFNAMHSCLHDLKLNGNEFDHILVDGTQWTTFKDITHECVPKGDNTYLCIAAAAILAKVRRDDYMIKLAAIHPHYNFEGSKGYYCTKHGKGILEFGITQYHRTQYVNTWLKKQK